MTDQVASTGPTASASVPVARLNHAVLYVRELDRSVDFYQRAFGFQEIAREGGMMAFLRASAHVLSELRALTGASDHGATKSLYGRDPDRNEFEIMWMVPREQWGEYENRGIIAPLDIEKEVARFG